MKFVFFLHLLNLSVISASRKQFQSFEDIVKYAAAIVDTITSESDAKNNKLRLLESSTGCDMCKDGSPPGNPSALVEPSNPDIATLTCQDGADYLKSNYLSSDPECPMYQDIASKNCGCPCTICSDGSAPTNPTALVDPSNPDIATLTCQDGANFLKANFLSSDSDCPMFQDIASKNCGCPEAALCPGACADGSMPAFGSVIFPFDYNQNGLFDDTCASIDEALKSSPANSEMCQGAAIGASFCGCNDDTPSCSPCYGNVAMPDYSKQFYDDGEMVTCGDLAMAIMIMSSMDGTSITPQVCESMQFSTSLYCDCPVLPPSFDKGCKLCEAGEPASATVVIENNTLTCRQLEILNSADMECEYAQFLPQEIKDTCCTSASPTNATITATTTRSPTKKPVASPTSPTTSNGSNVLLASVPCGAILSFLVLIFPLTML